MCVCFGYKLHFSHSWLSPIPSFMLLCITIPVSSTQNGQIPWDEALELLQAQKMLYWCIPVLSSVVLHPPSERWRSKFHRCERLCWSAVQDTVKQNNMRTLGYEGHTLLMSSCLESSAMEEANLVSAGEPQSVQHGNKNVSWNQQAQDVGTADEPVLSTVSVDFRWYPNDGHSWLEWSDKRQGNRETAHAPVCHQELLCSALTPSRESMVQPDGHRGSEQQGKYHIVYNREVLLVGRVHRDCLLAAGEQGLFLLQSHNQIDGKHLCPHPSVRRCQQPWRK